MRRAICLALLALFIAAIISGTVLSGTLVDQSALTGREAWHLVHGWSTRLLLAATILHIVAVRKALAALFRSKKAAR